MQVQNLQQLSWEEFEVNNRLDRAMTDAFEQLWKTSQHRKLPLRTAAYVQGLNSVMEAHRNRGFDWSCYKKNSTVMNNYKRAESRILISWDEYSLHRKLYQDRLAAFCSPFIESTTQGIFKKCCGVLVRYACIVAYMPLLYWLCIGYYCSFEHAHLNVKEGRTDTTMLVFGTPRRLWQMVPFLAVRAHLPWSALIVTSQC